MTRRGLLAAAASAALSLPTGGAASAAPPSARKPLRRPPDRSVDAALAAPLTRYNRHLKGGAHTNAGGVSGGAPVVLAFAAHTGVERADGRLLEQMRYTLTGGNDITANGGYPAQHERNATALFALARLTPRVWGRLSPEEVRRADLLMQAALVASAFTTADANPFVMAKTQQHALDGDPNLGRDWNPNYREGMVGMLTVAPVYFGGGEKVSALLEGYHHTSFVRELEGAGLTNLHETFTWKAAHPESGAPTGEMIERVIKGYRYKGVPATDPMRIYALLTADTYGKSVFCGLNGGKGIELPDGTRAGTLPDGCDSLPNLGKPGMLKELDSRDANGPRSSTLYAFDGFRANLVNHLVLLAGGLWRPGREADECLARMQVGIPDLWYRVERGYRNYAKGKAQAVLSPTDGSGFAFTRPLWDEVVRPYHDLA